MALSVTREGPVLRLQIDRPDRRNAIDSELSGEIVEALLEVGNDDSCRVVVLSAAGKGFSAGGDFFAEGPDPTKWSLAEGHFRAVRALLEIPKPVIGRVHGFALGAGMDVALACDLRVTTNDAVLGAIYLWAGGAEGTFLLPRLIGVAKTQELLYLGERFTGREAAEMGLFHRAVDEADLDRTVEQMVDRLSSGPTSIIGLAKKALLESAYATPEIAMQVELAACQASLATNDCKEGFDAFVEKRPPNFSGT